MSLFRKRRDRLAPKGCSEVPEGPRDSFGGSRWGSPLEAFGREIPCMLPHMILRDKETTKYICPNSGIKFAYILYTLNNSQTQ